MNTQVCRKCLHLTTLIDWAHTYFSSNLFQMPWYGDSSRSRFNVLVTKLAAQASWFNWLSRHVFWQTYNNVCRQMSRGYHFATPWLLQPAELTDPTHNSTWDVHVGTYLPTLARFMWYSLYDQKWIHLADTNKSISWTWKVTDSSSPKDEGQNEMLSSTANQCWERVQLC